MLTQFLLTMLNSPTHDFFQVVHHIAHGLQWYPHCREFVTFPRHFTPKPYGHMQYDGSIHWVCRFYDKAGTMHPAAHLAAAGRALRHVARALGALAMHASMHLSGKAAR